MPPYKLEKVGKGYKVKTKSGPNKGKTHSNKPLSHARALRQLRAMYANMPKGDK